MSNFLAIATVTATLRQTLQTAVGTDVAGATVTTLRPDAPENGAAEARVNLYLYQVTPNAAWRNADLPTRNPAGRLVDRPQVALDLHYLLSFYGNEGDLTPQRLLGSVARTFHARPVLMRQTIRDTIASPSFSFLAGSNLADDVELVKFTPTALSLEELSKLWSVFLQTPYTLSVAYQGTVVLIESEESHQTALPVRERNLYAAPFRQPAIEEVRSQAGPNQLIVVGSTLVIRGQRLSGEITQVRIGGSGPVTPIALSDTELSLLLTEPPLPAGTLRAGVQGLQVVQPMLLGTPLVAHRGVESNVAAFVLHPTIVPPLTASTIGTPAGPQMIVTVKLKPDVGKTQRVMLLLNELGSGSPRAYSFPAPSRAGDTDSIAIPISGVKAADYLVRVQIDGAESPLSADATGAYDLPKVTIL
jgi:Pvc16 N-terminal domain